MTKHAIGRLKAHANNPFPIRKTHFVLDVFKNERLARGCIIYFDDITRYFSLKNKKQIKQIDFLTEDGFLK